MYVQAAVLIAFILVGYVFNFELFGVPPARSRTQFRGLEVHDLNRLSIKDSILTRPFRIELIGYTRAHFPNTIQWHFVSFH